MSNSPQDQQSKENIVTSHMRASVKARYEEVYLKQSQEQKRLKRSQVITGILGGVAFVIFWYI